MAVIVPGNNEQCVLGYFICAELHVPACHLGLGRGGGVPEAEERSCQSLVCCAIYCPGVGRPVSMHQASFEWEQPFYNLRQR